MNNSSSLQAWIQKVVADQLVGWAGALEKRSLYISLSFEGEQVSEMTLDPSSCEFAEERDGRAGCWFVYHFDPRWLLRRIPADAQECHWELHNDRGEIVHRFIMTISDWMRSVEVPLESLEDLLLYLPQSRWSAVLSRWDLSKLIKALEFFWQLKLADVLPDSLSLLEDKIRLKLSNGERIEEVSDINGLEEWMRQRQLLSNQESLPMCTEVHLPGKEELEDRDRFFKQAKEYFASLTCKRELELTEVRTWLTQYVLDDKSFLSLEQSLAFLQSWRWIEGQVSRSRESDDYFATLQKAFEWLLRYRPEEFVSWYKKEVEERVFDSQFLLAEELLAHLPPEYRWIGGVETLRQRVIEALDEGKRESYWELLGYLESIAPEKVRTLRYRLIASEELTSKVGEENLPLYYRKLRYGGRYGALEAARELKDPSLIRDKEEEWIRANLRYSDHSPLRSWYRDALESRLESTVSRQKYIKQLYRTLTDLQWKNRERRQLWRLALSEWLFDNMQGEKSDIPETLKECVRVYFSDDQEVRGWLALARWWSSEVEFTSNDERDLAKLWDDNEIPSDERKSRYLRQRMIFPYTLVAIYSCQAYQDTRQRQVRESWIQELQQLGISYRFVMGGAKEDREDEDCLYLSVSDSYESLPQKSVAMFDYLRCFTDYERFYKIDDDCLLNPYALFSEPSIYSASYYGRVLQRQPGETDRCWHQSKASTPEMKASVDLSPEPSWYADGSTGYLLDRYAAGVLVGAYNDPQNRFLISVSFMEDKLVGDLLNRKGYRPSGTNFAARIHRKIASDIEATFWEYHPYPRRDNRVMVFHSETASGREAAWRYFCTPTTSEEPAGRLISNAPLDHFLSWGEGQQPIVEELRIEVEALALAETLCIVCEPFEEVDDFEKWWESLSLHKGEHLLYLHRGQCERLLEQMADRGCSLCVTTQPIDFSRGGKSWIEAIAITYGQGRKIRILTPDGDVYVKNEIFDLSISDKELFR